MSVKKHLVTTSSRFIIVLFFSLLISCRNNSTSNNLIKTKHGWKEYTVNQKGDSIMIIYNSEKKKTSAVTFKNGLYNGVGYNYYPNGVVKNEIHYKAGQKNGITKWFYENGNLYRLTTYKNAKKDGVRKKYYEDGKLKSEVMFKDGNPLPGLKEYKKDGTFYTNLPKIHFREINRLAYERKFFLEVYLKPKGKKATFYRLKKIEGKEYEIGLPDAPKEGVARITYMVQPGQVLMEKLKIKVVATTKHGNPLVLYKSYNLAVENRF